VSGGKTARSCGTGRRPRASCQLLERGAGVCRGWRRCGAYSAMACRP